MHDEVVEVHTNMLKTPPNCIQKKSQIHTVDNNAKHPKANQNKKRTNMGTHLVYTYMDGVGVKSGA